MAPFSGDKASDQGVHVEIVTLAQLPWARIVISVLGMLLAMLLAALDQTVVATALPRIAADLGGFDQFAWVFSAYMLASTTSIPIMGKLSDIYGRKWVLAGGVVLFLIGSALCGSSQDMMQLIVSRGVQGLGAGSIIANSYAVVGDVFPPAQRGKWTWIVMAVFGVAIGLGPLAGGYLTDHFSWRWIFFINLPLGFIALMVILMGMANVRNPRVETVIDYRGVVALVACVIPLLLALTWAGKEYAWSSPHVIGLLVLSGVMAVLLVLSERAAREPIIPAVLFANPIFTVGIAVTFLTAVCMYGAIMLIPLYVQGVIGSSATNAGITLMPAMLSGVASAILAGQIISRTGHYRLLIIVAMSVMAVGAYLLTLLDASSSNADAVLYTAIAGAGIGATLPTFMIAVQNAFPHHMLGVVTASIQFFRNIGGAIGTAVLGSFVTIRLGDWLAESSASEAAGALPPSVVEGLTDPEIIVDPGAMARIRELAAEVEGGAAALDVVTDGLRGALAAAMHEVFLLGLGVTIVAVVIAVFFKELPLQKTLVVTPGEADLSHPD